MNEFIRLIVPLSYTVKICPEEAHFAPTAKEVALKGHAVASCHTSSR